MKKLFVLFFFSTYIFAFSQTLPLPPRDPQSATGTQIISTLIPLSLTAREDTIFNEVISGNVPDFIRNLVPVYDTVTISTTTYYVTYYVIPDYLALGCDTDYFLCPMTPLLAQRIADYLGFLLPTRKMVDIIWENATVKMAPQTIAPSAQMTTVPVFAQHDSMVWIQRQTFFPQHPLGELVAGDKKDVIISNHIYGNPSPDRVVIYGWHYQNGTPIQPLYYGHEETYADYSHGIRLVQNEILVNVCMKTIQEILTSSTLNSLLSDEGVIDTPRYPVTQPMVSIPKSFCVLNHGNDEILVKVLPDAGISGYSISLSTDGKCFPLPEKYSGSNILFDNLLDDTIYYVKLAAIGNNGGVSGYSEVLGSNTKNISSTSHYLVINGFDRTTSGNTCDFIIQHGESFHHIGKAFSSATNEAWTDSLILTDNYDALDFILGEESTADETFSTLEQQMLSQCQVPYFVSGSEIGWDLDHLGSTTDQDFYHQYLYASYVEDAPNNQSSTYYEAQFELPSFTSFLFNYDDGTHGTYNVSYPDVINPESPAFAIGFYSGFPSKYIGTYYWDKMVNLAIPFETIYPSEIRDSVMYWVDYILIHTTNIVSQDIDNRFLLFPNPCRDQITLHIQDNIQPLNIELYSSSGNLINKFKGITNIRSFSTKELPNGMYFLKIVGIRKTTTLNFVVNK